MCHNHTHPRKRPSKTSFQPIRPMEIRLKLAFAVNYSEADIERISKGILQRLIYHNDNCSLSHKVFLVTNRNVDRQDIKNYIDEIENKVRGYSGVKTIITTAVGVPMPWLNGYIVDTRNPINHLTRAFNAQYFP
jgi:hypothetical protein